MNIEFGTKIFNHQTQEIGLLIKIWKNKFADGEVDVLDYSGTHSPSFRFRISKKKFCHYIGLFALTGSLSSLRFAYRVIDFAFGSIIPFVTSFDSALPKIRFATCVNQNGKRYNIELDNIQPIEDFE